MCFSIIFGLRRSETLGLKWNSINLENDMITINHTVVKFSTVVRKDCTKSDVSNRAFPLMQVMKDIQEWLGHKDIQTTANIYSHLDISRKIQENR